MVKYHKKYALTSHLNLLIYTREGIVLRLSYVYPTLKDVG
jgi:hypothetical protein